jgi:hypothetical protein
MAMNGARSSYSLAQMNTSIKSFQPGVEIFDKYRISILFLVDGSFAALMLQLIGGS